MKIRLLAFSLVLGLPLLGPAATDQLQTNRLDPGWNLVAFQVLPTDRSPAAVFSSLGDNFVAAWTFVRDGGANQWTTFARPGTEQAAGNAAAAMDTIQIGRAYWVYVNQTEPAWKITGTAPAISPAINLVNGWNLISVPTGTGSLDEPVSIGAVFAAAGLDYDTVLRWEAGL